MAYKKNLSVGYIAVRNEGAWCWREHGCNGDSQRGGIFNRIVHGHDIHELAQYTYKKASESKHVELQSAADDRLYGCLISIRHKRTELEQFHELLKKRRIWAVLGPKPRLSSHIHTRKQDIDWYFETMNEAFG